MIYIGTKNNMKARSVPGIVLAPSNEWGGHYFMSLLSGKRVHGYTWTEVPIGADVIERVHELASIEQQPELVDGTVSFEWGNMTNTITNAHLNTSDDKASTDRDRNDARNEVDAINYIEENSNDTEYDDNIEKEMNIAMLEENDNDDSVLMNNDEDYDKDEDFFDNDDDEINEKIDKYTEHLHNQHEDDSLSVLQNLNTSIPDHTHERSNDEITNNSLYHTLEPEPEKTVNTVMNTSLDEPTNVDNNPSSYTGRPRREGAGTGVMSFEPSMGGKEHLIYKKKCMLHTKRMERNTKRARITLMMKRVRKDAKSTSSFFQMAMNATFLSAQMSAKQGIKKFGDRAIAAIIKECIQLDKGAFPGKPVVEPIFAKDLSELEKKAAMSAVSLIKEKRCGKLKARICANGSKQKKYLSPDESVASPTSSNEGVLTSFMIDAYERRVIAILDIPGAYLHAKMKHTNRRILMKMQGQFVDYMCEADPRYKDYICYENGTKTIYLKLLRALYGCIESALLWYELFTSKLSKMGFTINPYDKCIANKMVNGKQCSVVWYVDDVKVSHVEKSVVEEVIKDLEYTFGKVNPVFGNKQEYLGMKIEIDDERNLHIDMRDQVSEIIQDFSEIISGSVSTPANRFLMDVNESEPTLNKSRSEEFHSTVAKLLYLEKRGRPDLEPTVAFYLHGSVILWNQTGGN